MAHLYYDERLSAAQLRTGERILIAGDEGRHAVRVARLRVGESVLIGDGAGILADCVVDRVERDAFTGRVVALREDSALGSPRVVLVQALAKGDRDERAVEQATEFGVDRIVPWQAARSVSRWSASPEKAEKGLAKWQRIAREASKQSLRARIPVIGPLISMQELARMAGSERVSMAVLHPWDQARLTDWARGTVAEASTRPDEVWIVVGPEGGIAPDELSALSTAGAAVGVLGDTVLRTSSAGAAALAVINTLLGRW